MNCAKCSSVMHTKQLSYSEKMIEVEVCDECGGTFYDFEELKCHLDQNKNTESNTLAIDRGDFIADHTGNTYTCPHCVIDMQEKIYLYDSGIHFDFCPNCYGIFLDTGEFDAIERYVDSLNGSKEGEAMEILGENLGQIAEDTQKDLLHTGAQWDQDIQRPAHPIINPEPRLEFATKFVIEHLL